MPTPTFTFRQFTIHQDRCAMKVGTDAVLLGAWAALPAASGVPAVSGASDVPVLPDVPGASAVSPLPLQPRDAGFSVLDMGTGTAIIALMAAQRGARRVVGVEIDAEAVGQARENVQASPFDGVVQIEQADLRTWRSDERFDVILSNPPFFREDTLSPKAARATARHAATLSFGDLVSCACHHLAPGGTFSVVLPAKEADHFAGICALQDLSLIRTTLVSTREGQSAKRVLMTFTNHLCPDRPERDTLTLTHADGRRTEAYARLTADFYLR